MLHLDRESEAGWVERAVAQLDEILVDHAHCEKKAASTALSLLFRYPEHAPLQQPLSRLAREELVHFEQVLELLRARGLRFRRQRPGPYAGRLLTACRAHEPERMLDLLLAASLIEARSCERFRLLADALDARDPELSTFYRGLLASEARHHALYVDLASALFPAPTVHARLAELAAHEARVVSEMPRIARVHC